MNKHTVKKVSYFMLGVLPASVWSALYIALINVSAELGAYILLLAILSGTAGLYIITFFEKHSVKTAVVLLLIGQVVMVYAVVDLGFHPFQAHNDLAELGMIGDQSHNYAVFFILNTFRFLLVSTPIMVALHYQFKVYKQWAADRLEHDQ